VLVEGNTVHAEGEPDEIDVLAGVTDRVGPTQPHRVVEVPVDRFGIAIPATAGVAVGGHDYEASGKPEGAEN
jgi:hypothetical protein